MLQFDYYKKDFSGVIYVTKDSQCVLEKAYGYAEKGLKVRNFVLTRFGAASGGKLFTAVGVLKLAEKGELNLSDEISKYIAELPESFKGVTLHHLLTHTSGIGDYFDEYAKKSYSSLWDEIPMYKIENTVDFLPMILNKEKLFEPGEKFRYNNAGYILLGLVIEKVSGLAYKDYTKKAIFSPCKMSDTGYFKMNMLPPRTAYGYIKLEDGSFRNNIYDLPVIGGADGGVYVTAVDMAKFWKELIAYELLSEEYTKKIFEIHTETGNEGIGFGYGLWIEHKDGKPRRYFLQGYDPGVNFKMVYYIKPDILVIALSNEDSGTKEACEEVEKALIEEFQFI